MAADLRAHLEDGGILLVPTAEGRIAACLAAAGPAAAALQACGPVAVGFASWLEARLFVEASAAATAAAEALLPGPLGLVCATSGFGLEEFERDGGGLEVRVPADGLLQALLQELGPLVLLAVPPGALLPALAGLATLAAEGRAGSGASTLVDARGPQAVVLHEGVIPREAVAAAWR